MSATEFEQFDWSKLNYENLGEEFSTNGHKEIFNLISHLKKMLNDAIETNEKKLLKLESDISDKNLQIRELENNKSQVF